MDAPELRIYSTQIGQEKADADSELAWEAFGEDACRAKLREIPGRWRGKNERSGLGGSAQPQMTRTGAKGCSGLSSLPSRPLRRALRRDVGKKPGPQKLSPPSGALGIPIELDLDPRAYRSE